MKVRRQAWRGRGEEPQAVYTLMLTTVGLSNLQKALEGNPDNSYAMKFLEELKWWSQHSGPKKETKE